jgi:hypothetical protein
MFDLSRQSTTPNKRISRARTSRSATLTVTAYGEFDGIGMGRLSNGDAFVTQRGLAALCGVQNAHIGTISRDWASQKPRILAIRGRLLQSRSEAHRVLTFEGRRLYCYDIDVAKAVICYYAQDAGARNHDEAKRNRARFKGDRLADFIRGHFEPATPAPAPPVDPVRFVPLDITEETPDLATAFLLHVLGMYALSFWLTMAYLNALRDRAIAAPWNRLGLYLPLKAIVEIQNEALRRAEAFSRRPA